jgi:hypothetical protein
MTLGRGGGKLPPEKLAATVVSALAAEREETYVGMARLLYALHL